MACGTAIGSDKPELQRVAVPRTDLRIDVPKNWEKGGVSGENVLVAYRAGKSFCPNLNIMAEDPDGKTADEVTDRWLGLLPSAEVHYRKKETIAGMEGVVCDASWRSILGGLRAVRLTTIYRGKALTITFVDKSADVTDPVRKTYLECLKSLTAGKPQP